MRPEETIFTNFYVKKTITTTIVSSCEYVSPSDLAEDFSEFFMVNIDKIRKALDTLNLLPSDTLQESPDS